MAISVIVTDQEHAFADVLAARLDDEDDPVTRPAVIPPRVKEPGAGGVRQMT